MNNTRYSRWDQIFADAIKRLKRAGYDVRELRQQFNFYKKEVLQHHEHSRPNSETSRGAWRSTLAPTAVTPMVSGP